MTPAEQLVETLTQSPAFRRCVTHVERLPPEPPEWGEPTHPLPANQARYLTSRGWRLYRHQCEAVDRLRTGAHCMLATGTASGKTLAFALPIMEVLAADPQATVLVTAPTKALAQDHLKTLEALAADLGLDVGAAVYDGDTPAARKTRIRGRSRLVVTNFYELHHVLAWHHQWDRFWRHLRFVVVDEAHTYRGVLGANVALVIRRLRRLAQGYGADPQFVLASATLANPAAFAEALTGVHVRVVDRDTAGRPSRTVVFYNPDVLGPGAASPHEETARLVAAAAAAGVQTLCFAVSRRTAELVAEWVRTAVAEHGALANRVAAYRAGYLPQERRDLEARFKAGEIRALVSTDALEVGIDIGELDAVVVSGFPGSMISCRQQMGRAGRAGQPAVCVYVPFADPLDQYWARHPAEFFGRPHEQAVLDWRNPYLLTGHLLCAAAERPLPLAEAAAYFGAGAADLLAALTAQGLLAATARGYVFQSHPAPHPSVPLDGLGSQPTIRLLVDGHELLETMDWSRALFQAHPGAVLLHQGRPHVVEHLDLEGHVATLAARPVDYWTETADVTDIRILAETDRRPTGGGWAHLGEVEVTTRIPGYRVKKGGHVVAYEALDLPDLRYRAQAVWLTLPADWEDTGGRGGSVMPGLHAAEHALLVETLARLAAGELLLPPVDSGPPAGESACAP
jgi:DEAD/DEAH box helicase domain-containing protein